MPEPLEASRRWDVAIIGTGIGGATVGWALAKRGLSVVFLEKGGRIEPGIAAGDDVTAEARLARGWWPHPVSQKKGAAQYERFFAPLGCAVGGSSIHYAAALERMAASDFEDLQTPRQGVVSWPVTFNEFVPFYEAAEALYGICQTSTPAAQQRLSEWDRALMEAMRKNGLQPDLLHVAMRYDEQCEECVGKVCPRECKADARVACLNEALRQPECHIIEHCDVQGLDAEDRLIRSIRARHSGQNIEVLARVVVLAAGALHSPHILLRSGNAAWPRGLANHSDQIGRNLMFHTADIYALWAPRRLDRRGRQKKSLSVRDFYIHDGQRLGYVQSMGLDAGRGAIAVYMKDTLRRWGVRNELLLSSIVKLPSHIAAYMLGGASVFAAMTEDDPDPDNRLVLDPTEPDGCSFVYVITENLRQRADALREVFARSVRPWRLRRLSPGLAMNYGHPCGTCRFGDDPHSSVLDRNCRTHDLENLYVVDASFMPRSGAVNPSLTIAANALRVERHIAERVSELRTHTQHALSARSL
jgi:choline dehydrogenase-like flavoprotein